jgi:hypothetical protein
MWQRRLYPCDVFTETSEEVAPYYLADFRHDLLIRTLKAKVFVAWIPDLLGF